MSEEIEAFEKEANMFYKDTGFFAPGKSEPPAAIGQQDFDRCEVRFLMKKAWDAGRRRADDAGRLTGAVERIKAMPFMVYTRFLKTGAEEFLPRASVFAALGIAPAAPSAEPCANCDGKGYLGDTASRHFPRCLACHPAPAKEDEKR